MHCQWVSEGAVLAEAGGKARLQRWHKVWANLQEEFEYDAVRANEWEPFPAEYTQVERVIAEREEYEPGEPPRRQLLVKWQGLSYADASWEDADDVADDEAIAAFERVQKLPTNPRHLKALPKGEETDVVLVSCGGAGLEDGEDRDKLVKVRVYFYLFP